MRLERKRKNSRTRSILATILTSSMLLFQSCRTSLAVDGSDLYWPPFPDPQGVVKHDLTTDTVFMPLWYWMDITDYVIEVEQNILLLHPP